MEEINLHACITIDVKGQRFFSQDDIPVHIGKHPSNELFVSVYVPRTTENFNTLMELNQSFTVDENDYYYKFYVLISEITDVVR